MMYVRCKREKQTVFITLDSNDTIDDLKRKLSAIIKVSPDNINIVSPDGTSYAENNAVVCWVQKLEGNKSIIVLNGK
jgi:hypothetical protein